MSRRFMQISLGLLLQIMAVAASAQDLDVQQQLDRSIIGPQLSLTEVQRFCELRVQPIPSFDTAERWQKFADETRRRTLDQVVFRGEAAKWKSADRKIEWLDTIPGGKGYQIKKVRFEALPGM